MQTGIYTDIPAADYHAMTEYVSNSMLGRFARCPAAVKVQDEDSKALTFGSMFHKHTLEPYTFADEYAVAPEGIDRRTTAGKAAWAEFEQTAQYRTVVTAADYALAKQMAAAINAHPFASRLMQTPGRATEQSVFWLDGLSGEPCKCRIDLTFPEQRTLVDLKSTSDASEEAFLRSVIKYGYARQSAMYLDGRNAVSADPFDTFIFIAVEKTAPFRVEVYRMDDGLIDYGREEYRRLLAEYSACREADTFHNYRNEGITTLYRPAYL